MNTRKRYAVMQSNAKTKSAENLQEDVARELAEVVAHDWQNERKAKVEKIKKAVEAGSYKIDSTEVAKSILSEE